MIQFCKPSITWREKLAVLRVLNSGDVSQGSAVQEFEKSFAKYVGAKHAIAVGSGTHALFLSLAALGVGPGDAVIVPSLTFTASASVILHAGAEIVFADVKPSDFCLDWNEVAELRKLKDNVKAIIAVDLTGNDSTEPDEMMPADLPIIVDSAHRIERNCHKYGQIRTYSFHGTKPITTGFGGMVTTDSDAVAEFIRIARMHGCFKAGWENGEINNSTKRYGYEVLFPGWKMNMSNIQAALGLAQLKRLDKMDARRQDIVDLYNHLLEPAGEPLETIHRHGLHLYPIFVNNRDKFLDLMHAAGIECSVHFKPLHTMTAYQAIKPLRPLKVTEWLGDRIVSLPLYPDLKHNDVYAICDQINETGLLLSH